MHSSSSAAAAAAPPRRPPRRWKSTSTSGSCCDDSIMLDDISEIDVFCPRVPLRTKSCEELEAELLAFQQQDDEQDAAAAAIPAQIDLSQLAQNLRQVQLEEGDLMWDSDDDDEEDDKNNDNHDRPRRGHNILGPTHSFLSVGSSMTAAQQREPGRFVTPASSFYNNNNTATNVAPMDLTCAGVQPVERVTVDPYRFMTADMSFRLPLVGSLTDDHFVVHKKKPKASLNDGDDDDIDQDLLKKPSGRKTIQLDDAAMPSISLDDEEDELRPQEAAQDTAPAKPIMLGKLKRESRRLVRPNLPF